MKNKLTLLVIVMAFLLPGLSAQEEQVLNVNYTVEVMEQNSIFSPLLQNSTIEVFLSQQHYKSVLRSPMMDIIKHSRQGEDASVTIFQSEQGNYFSLDEQGSALSKELFDQGGDLTLRLLKDTTTSFENLPTALYELEMAFAGLNIRMLIHSTEEAPFDAYEFSDLPLMNFPFDAIEGFPLKIDGYIQKPNETEQKVFEYRLQSYELLDQYSFKIDTAGMKMMPAPF